MYRMSDHDPLLVGLAAQRRAGHHEPGAACHHHAGPDGTVLEATAYDPDGGPVTYAWDLDNDGAFETSGQSAVFPTTGGVGTFPSRSR